MDFKKLTKISDAFSTEDAREDAIRSYLEEVDINELVRIHNYVGEELNEPDSRVYDMDDEELNNIFPNAWDAMRSAFYGDFNPADKFCTFNGYGNIITFSDKRDENCRIEISEIVDFFMENPDALEEAGIDIDSTEEE